MATLAEIYAEIIRKLIQFLESKGNIYDVPNWMLYAELKGDTVTIRGTTGKFFPPEFVEALDLDVEQLLYEALKTVHIDPHLGENPFFHAKFKRPVPVAAVGDD